MTTEIKKVNSITPLTMGLADIERTAIAVLAGEYEDPDGISDDILNSLIDTYAVKSLSNQYSLATASGNPMKYLCETFFYPTIRVKGKGDEREIERSQKSFDLVRANKTFHSLGANKDWESKASDLCTDMSYHAALALGANTTAEFIANNRLSRRVQKTRNEIAEGKNPVSARKLMPALEELVQAMLGEEYHISKYDFNYIKLTLVSDKANSARAVTDKKLNGFVKLVMKVCHRVLIGAEGYEYDSKLIKKAK